MAAREHPGDQLVGGDYHETLDAYIPCLGDFYNVIAGKLVSSWEIRRHNLWFNCGSVRNSLPEQGWKIHISAERSSAREVLDRVSSILVARETDFKFALDMRTLLLLNGKSWPRGSSGKFITIYPSDSHVFLELIEQLYRETREFSGPYILSDHCYKDSRVVFYRYGGFRNREILDVTGERTPVLRAPDGAEIPDRRVAYPLTPPWAENVLPRCEFGDVANHSLSLCRNRFLIDGVIEFSNAGGIYRGTDTLTGSPVILKEARPFIEASDRKDAVTLLKKEHSLLTLLASTGIAPRPIHLFQEGTHWFLVEEYIEGTSLAKFAASNSILLRTRPKNEDFQLWYKTFRALCLRLIEAVQTLHRYGIVFSDLSPNNVIVTEDGEDLKLIDFEGAFQPETDSPANIFTPGFASPQRLKGAEAGFADDCYSVGALIMAYLLPVNSLFHCNPDARGEFMASVEQDARLPHEVAKMILAMTDSDPKLRPSLNAAADVLTVSCNSEPKNDEAEATWEDHNGVVDGIVEHIRRVASPKRSDRLFPADSCAFTTNALSVAFGATGTAYALQRATGSVPGPVIDWIMDHRLKCDNYPPGLYVGLSGIAWALSEMGELERAEHILQLTFQHRLLNQSFDLFYGLAGWGMTCLHFFMKTANELYLHKALECGSRLLSYSSGPCQMAWEQQAGRPLGLAHGSSGVALYLLYLYQVTQEEEFLSAGTRALATDLTAAHETIDGGYTWSANAGSRNITYPYWRYGSAGVGTAVLRYHALTGDRTYAEALDKIFIDTDRKYAVLPGHFSGLSGIGSFLLDAWNFTGETKYHSSAGRIAESLMKFKVNRNGIAFPGDRLSRLCCDYGTGSAGVVLFLNRLAAGAKADFLLDELLDKRQTHALRTASACRNV